MFKISEIWEKYGFEILVYGSLFLIFIYALLRIGKEGSWNSVSNVVLKNGFKNNSPSLTHDKSSSSGEAECKRVLEKYFNKPFHKYRPNFLNNPITDNNLELDCYNEEVGLAVEYNGAQHYKYTPYFHKSKEAFHNQQYRDYIKRDLCKKNGIRLIEVPYTVKVHDIENYILGKLL